MGAHSCFWPTTTMRLVQVMTSVAPGMRALGNTHKLHVRCIDHKPDAIHTTNDTHLYDVVAVHELETCIRVECNIAQEQKKYVLVFAVRQHRLTHCSRTPKPKTGVPFPETMQQYVETTPTMGQPIKHARHRQQAVGQAIHYLASVIFGTQTAQVCRFASHEG